jgi:hypothetical protein
MVDRAWFMVYGVWYLEYGFPISNKLQTINHKL